jgi:hypothetical protein
LIEKVRIEWKGGDGILVIYDLDGPQFDYILQHINNLNHLREFLDAIKVEQRGK